LQKKYTRWWEFLEYAMWQFWPRKMASRCAEHWVPLKCEPDMRVFPESNKSSDIVQMFEGIMWKDATIHFQEYATSVKKQNDLFIITTNNTVYEFDIVVLTTWGNAYAHTGSTWDGYEIAKQFWHTISPLWPSLNSFLIEEERIKQCSGISFSKAKLSRPVSQKVESQGPVLLTHFGISWPATFTYSSQIPYIPISSHEPHTVLLTPFAERPMQRRQDWFNTKAHEDSKKQLSTILWYEFTKRRVDAFLSHYALDGTKMICNVSRDERKHLAKLLGDGMEVTLIARRPWDEFVTAGWVNTDEISPETMESKLCPGLYFAWEILNIDAVTWGFNFQSCWATGRCAWRAIVGIYIATP
jgi:predicted Rossmann fold flavoprotein